MYELISHSAGTRLQQLDSFLPWLFTFPAVTVFLLYFYAVRYSNRHYPPWPVWRIIIWGLGILSAGTALIGPVAERAHHDFSFHMIGHLLLGMLAPLLIALSAPMTLLFRSLSVPAARKLTRLLRSWPIKAISDPVSASLLNIGGLWLIYTTSLYGMMHSYPAVFLLIHLHIFLAGYLFTVSIIYIDPAPHRKSYLYRSVILILALAGHGILAKYIYAHPPAVVPAEEAELGGMIMYYGGDVIDLFLIFILCLDWYRSTGRKSSVLKQKKMLYSGK